MNKITICLSDVNCEILNEKNKQTYDAYLLLIKQ